MCGITGIINLQSPETDRDILKRMTGTLSRRGPDAEGFTFAPHVGLGHRRLSIIDLNSGSQPLTTNDGRYTIVFNGEIYNYRELRTDLEKIGVLFHTQSDTEVLLQLFVNEGASCLTKLNGMFAFAIWDHQEKSLFAARDRMGKKPFYYALIPSQKSTPAFFIFASELKALLEFPGLSKKINTSAVRHFFTYEYVPSPLSIIEGIQKLRPGYWLSLEKDGLLITQRYWNQPFGEPIDDDENTASKKLLGLLDQAVQYRLISDVPLGVFLSGGIDSSSIVALMARHRKGKDIKTFSIYFDEESYDESFYCETVAKKFGTDHHAQKLSAKTLLDIFPDVINYLDEPFADASILPTYLLSRFTREHVTVALGGDGADEIFAGYPTFFASRAANVYKKIPALIRNGIASLVQKLPASERNMSFDFKARQFLSGISYDGVLRQQVWLSGINPSEQKKLFTPDFFGQSDCDTLDLLRQEMTSCVSQNPGDQLLYFYQKFYLEGDILVKTDRASMANSLEVRAPYLDKDVVDYVTRLPYSYKLKGVTTKYLLKKTLNRMLPALITQRRKKGFGIPLTGWLKNELKPLLTSQLNQKRIEKDGIFQWPTIQKTLQNHESGRLNQRKQLFNLLVFHLWMDSLGTTYKF